MSFTMALASLAMSVQPSTSTDAIVVTARRISDHRAALEACLARNCSTNEDVDASTALAESLFLAGEYRDARTVLRGSIGRNRRAAATFPEPVSDLYRANSRVARHLGLDQDAQRSTYEALRALRTGLPQEDHRHFSARLEIAQSLVAFGRTTEARRELNILITRARAAGREDVVTSAELRLLWIDYLESPRGPVWDRLGEMAQITDPQQQARALGAKMLLVRMYSEAGEHALAANLIEELRRAGGQRHLLYTPAFALAAHDMGGRTDADANRLSLIGGNAFGGGSSGDAGTGSSGGVASGGGTPTGEQANRLYGFGGSTTNRLTETFENEWIDVGFWVEPDGRTAEIEVLRRGSSASGWQGRLVRSIQERRYNPNPDGIRTYRLERYSYTAGMDSRNTGTRLAQRTPRARLEFFDLTNLDEETNSLLRSTDQVSE